MSAFRTASARIGWTLCSETNTFSACYVCELSGGDRSARRRRRPVAEASHVGRRGDETHERTQGSAGVSSLSDAERDAHEVVQALTALSTLLSRTDGAEGAETRRRKQEAAKDEAPG